ncbi:MAG: hypothetical protein ABT00_20240 [Bordetella sp. SCN 68-11]|nr:MAG: hypothetical protein ABT00_20240 [Bordetella sp. SCN 68-11]
MISVPAHTLDHGSRVARASFKLRRRLGRNPTEQELASATGLSARAVKTACGVSTLRGRMVSISAPISNREGSLTLGDVIEADEGERPDVIVANAIDAAAAREAIDAAVATFVPRHREVVRLRLIDGLTLEEAGDRMGVTRERVRQIEMTAARRLRTALANHPAVLGILGRTPLLEERDDEDDSALLSAKDLRARTGLAAADLTERISRGEFPPHALRDRRGQRLWRESAVERWQA